MKKFSSPRRNALIKIKEYFDPYIDLKLSTWFKLEEHIQIKKYKTRETIIPSIEKDETHFSFILHGGAVMLLDNAPKKICIEMCIENEFIYDPISFNNKEVSNVLIQTFEKTIIAYFKVPIPILVPDNFNNYFSSIILETKYKKLETIHRLTPLPGYDRYKKFCELFPHYINRVPQRFISSCLGVSPKSLSRYRRDLLNDK